jgi:hyaluronoglucosaminidase
LDWEQWDPLYDRNWDSRNIYRIESIKKVESENPGKSKDEILKIAKTNFEQSAHNFMISTLTLGKKLRPKASWGYYRFPDCHDGENHPDCSAKSKAWDDETDWLWENSDGIYPSTYIGEGIKNLVNVTKYVRSRTQEAWRIIPENSPNKPIYHYHR